MKHVEQLRNIGIINSTTRLHLVGSFYEFYMTMHGSMNIKLIGGVITFYKRHKIGGDKTIFRNKRHQKVHQVISTQMINYNQ
jgi:hypothetical protein